MAEKQQRERVRVVQDDGFERRQQVTEYKPAARSVILSRTVQFIWLLASILLGIIAFRFILRLIAANPDSGFADLIYTISDPFVLPFEGIVNLFSIGSVSVVDIAAVFAIVVYALVTWVIVRFLYIFFDSPGGVRRVRTYERQRLEGD